MTAVEGYAEVLMDRAFDGEYADLRRKLDERRGGGGPVQPARAGCSGLGLKRRQYAARAPPSSDTSPTPGDRGGRRRLGTS